MNNSCITYQCVSIMTSDEEHFRLEFTIYFSTKSEDSTPWITSQTFQTKRLQFVKAVKYIYQQAISLDDCFP